MKIQLDVLNKTIKLEESINLGEFADILYKLLPHDWKQYKLETNVTINNWSSPIIIDRWVSPTYYPWWYNPYSPTITYTSGELTTNGNNLFVGTTNADNNTFTASANNAVVEIPHSDGVYNLEVN